MILTILGSGTGIPHPERAAPGFVLEIGSRAILLDPSAGSLHRLVRLGIDYRKLETVVLSHFHHDHTGDLISLLLAMRLDPDAPQRLTLIGPPGLDRFYMSLIGLHGEWVALIRRRLHVHEVVQWRSEFDGYELSSFPVVHSDRSIGFRWTDSNGSVFAYSGDTDYCSGLLHLAQGADAALIEASHPHAHKVSGHLSGLLAGKVAAEAEVKRLILHHRYPICDDFDLVSEVRDGGFKGPVELASDGSRIEIV